MTAPIQRSDIGAGAASLSLRDALDYIGPEGEKKYFTLTQSGQNQGNSWFFRLSFDDQAKLRGSLYDPRETNDTWAIRMALAYLLLS